MSQCDFKSSIKVISSKQEKVYSVLSDFNNLEKIREGLENPAVAEQINNMSSNSSVNVQEELKKMKFDTDSISVDVPGMGNVTMRIIERDVPKCIKCEADGTPVPINMWIQLLPQEETSCKMLITIRAELNMFIKGMVSKPLQKGVERMADILASLPYENL